MNDDVVWSKAAVLSEAHRLERSKFTSIYAGKWLRGSGYSPGKSGRVLC
jgi:hypothetical protein